jgi:DnaK suppressor protein
LRDGDRFQERGGRGTLPEMGEPHVVGPGGSAERSGDAAMDMLVNEARESLLQRRSSLRGALRDNDWRRGEREPDPVDEAAEESAGEVRERLTERELRELRDIDDALVRIEQGGFGHCARCGGAIGRHRLRAVPEARHCMACSAQVVR